MGPGGIWDPRSRLDRNFASRGKLDARQRWRTRLRHGDTDSQNLSEFQVLWSNTLSVVTEKVNVQKGKRKVPKSFPLSSRLVMDRKLVQLFAGECRGTIATIYH